MSDELHRWMALTAEQRAEIEQEGRDGYRTSAAMMTSVLAGDRLAAVKLARQWPHEDRMLVLALVDVLEYVHSAWAEALMLTKEGRPATRQEIVVSWTALAEEMSLALAEAEAAQ